MKVIQLDQGTPEWHQFRATHLTASQAPEMLGHGYESRSTFIRNWGRQKPVNDHMQRIFDRGHELEAAALPLACEIVGEDLAPLTGVADDNALPLHHLTDAEQAALLGRLSASFDGIDMHHTVCWEHKTWNQKIQAALDAGEIPLQYRIQMEQQLMVSEADRCLFMASDEQNCCYQWYEPDPTLRLQICQGWVQFLDDLADHGGVRDVSQDNDWLVLEGQLSESRRRLEREQRTYDHIKAQMLEYAAEGDVEGLNYKVIRIQRKGSISYAKAFKAEGINIDLEPYRGEPVESVQLKEIKN